MRCPKPPATRQLTYQAAQRARDVAEKAMADALAASRLAHQEHNTSQHAVRDAEAALDRARTLYRDAAGSGKDDD